MKNTIVDAYLTHSRTPLITEIRSNGRIRKVARLQRGEATGGWRIEEQELKAKYGSAWLGVLGVEAAARKASELS